MRTLIHFRLNPTQCRLKSCFNARDLTCCTKHLTRSISHICSHRDLEIVQSLMRILDIDHFLLDTLRCNVLYCMSLAFACIRNGDTMGKLTQTVELYSVGFVLCAFSMLFTTSIDNQTHPKHATCSAQNLSELLELIQTSKLITVTEVRPLLSACCCPCYL